MCAAMDRTLLQAFTENFYFYGHFASAMENAFKFGRREWKYYICGIQQVKCEGIKTSQIEQISLTCLRFFFLLILHLSLIY